LVITGNSFTFSVPDRDKGTVGKRVPDQFVDLFGVVSFIHDMKVRISAAVTVVVRLSIR
jgi:hypothetical protein